MSVQTLNTKGATLAVPLPDSIAIYGALTFLAARCPVHSQFNAVALNQLFLPAVERKCVRLFQNADGLPCAALLWARLSDDVEKQMIADNRPPAPEDWNSGSNLWFLDIMAPFGHGLQVARHLARNPPEDAFSFARIGADGRLRKTTRIAKSAGSGRAIIAHFLNAKSGT